MKNPPPNHVGPLLTSRFGPECAEAFDDVTDENTDGLLQSMAARGSCRAFTDQLVPATLLSKLGAIALSSPTKSDLQQRDIVLVTDPAHRKRLADLADGQAWVAEAPVLAVFCANNRRQRLLHEWRGVTFANDHLDAFFNASVDAGIALSAFVTAAEASGLGCCPISAMRNNAAAVSELLRLPDHVFPIAGLAIGYPAAVPQISMRLPLSATLHFDHYDEAGLENRIQSYDQARSAIQPYDTQRFTDEFGSVETYGWSEDKVRQYSHPERADFGGFIRSKGFCLD